MVCLVELSGLDSNKCRAFLAFKQQVAKHPDRFTKLNAQREQPVINREIDEFGEIATKRLQQAFRIPFTDEDIDVIISAYNSGTSTYKIAKQYGCCKNTISDLLKQHGVYVTNRKVQSKLPTDKVIKMYENMSTVEKIAECFDVSACSIRKCLVEHGIKLRSRWDY